MNDEIVKNPGKRLFITRAPVVALGTAVAAGFGGFKLGQESTQQPQSESAEAVNARASIMQYVETLHRQLGNKEVNLFKLAVDEEYITPEAAGTIAGAWGEPRPTNLEVLTYGSLDIDPRPQNELYAAFDRLRTIGILNTKLDTVIRTSKFVVTRNPHNGLTKFSVVFDPPENDRLHEARGTHVGEDVLISTLVRSTFNNARSLLFDSVSAMHNLNPVIQNSPGSDPVVPEEPISPNSTPTKVPSGSI